MADFDEVLRLTPGKKKLNLHASYAIFEAGEFADRDAIQPKHFSRWVAYAKERGLGIDFNPTFFSHSDGQGRPDALVPGRDDPPLLGRARQALHGHCGVFRRARPASPASSTSGSPTAIRITRQTRLSPRRRYAQSMDEILSVPYDKTKVFPCIESKVFGIGLEAYTVGSAEFCTNYVNTRRITPLMDNGHYHPTELVSDKISSMLLFNDRLALHITRPMRWDSDHVVLFDDETREMMKEIVRADALGRVFLATDYFDASINRISAWVTGLHSVQKALLYALLEPKSLKKLQDENNFTELMVRQEELKTMPFGAVWEEYLRRENIPQDYFAEIKRYEADVLSKR